MFLMLTEAQRSVGLLVPGTLMICWVLWESLKYLYTPWNCVPMPISQSMVLADILNQRRTSLASARQWVYSMKSRNASSLVQ